MWKIFSNYLQKFRRTKKVIFSNPKQVEQVLQIQEEVIRNKLVKDGLLFKRIYLPVPLTGDRKDCLLFFSIPQEGVFINISSNLPENVKNSTFFGIVKQQKSCYDSYELMVKECSDEKGKQNKKEMVGYPLLSYN